MIAAGPQRQTGKQHDPHLIHKNAIYSSGDICDPCGWVPQVLGDAIDDVCGVFVLVGWYIGAARVNCRANKLEFNHFLAA